MNQCTVQGVVHGLNYQQTKVGVSVLNMRLITRSGPGQQFFKITLWRGEADLWAGKVSEGDVLQVTGPVYLSQWWSTAAEAMRFDLEIVPEVIEAIAEEGNDDC